MVFSKIFSANVFLKSFATVKKKKKYHGITKELFWKTVIYFQQLKATPRIRRKESGMCSPPQLSYDTLLSVQNCSNYSEIRSMLFFFNAFN